MTHPLAAADYVPVVALIALVLSALTFIATQLNTRDSSTKGTIGQLRQRVRDLEEDNDRLQARNQVLIDENIHLMQMLVNRGGSSGSSGSTHG